MFLSIAAAFYGAAIWIGIGMIAAQAEAWDTPLYMIVGLPLMLFGSGILAFSSPRHAWRFGMLICGAQFALLLLQGLSEPLLPVGALLFGVLTLPCLVVSWIGSTLRRRYDLRYGDRPDADGRRTSASH